MVAATDDGVAHEKMAPWSLPAWRSSKMKRVVSSTLAAETRSLLNGLGHAECIAAHLS